MTLSKTDTPSVTPEDATRRRIHAALSTHARLLNAIGFLIVMLLIFVALEPTVFLNWRIYYSALSVIPIAIVMVVPLVFVVAAGEIDLSFPSSVGLSALFFALTVDSGMSPWLGLVFGALAGTAVGIANGLLVSMLGLSSLVVTLGMNFFVRGIVHVIAQGKSMSLAELRDTAFYATFVGDVGRFPTQLLWGLAAAAVGLALFSRHRFGAHARAVGDNSAAAKDMGINVVGVRVATFAYVGLSAGLAGVLVCTINTNFFPTTGEGYLLPVLAALFVGGTPTWGGVGTIAGAVVGAITVGFIETGVISVGLTGFYTQLAFGFVVIISLLGHRFAPGRRRSA